MILLYIFLGLIGLILLFCLFIAVCALFVNPRREYDNNSPFYRFLLNFCTAVVLKTARIKLHITGFEKVPENKRVLFVSNHRSNFDPITTWYVFRKWTPSFVSKNENFSIPVFGRYIRRCGFMAIDRKNPRKAAKTINKAARLMKEDKMSIGVYPEGTRSRNNKLLPFHNAVFKIAQKAEAPIVVLSVDGTEKVKENFPLHRTDIYLDVLEVIPEDKIKGIKTEEIGNHITKLLLDALQKQDEIR